MATENNTNENNAPELQRPNVGEPVRERAAGKWLIWFIAILAVALIASFLF